MLTLKDIRVLIAASELEENVSDPRYSVSPVIVEVEKDRYECLGTCFFITETGIFITAKHVLEDVYPQKEILEEQKNYLDEEFDAKKTIKISRQVLIPQFLPNNQALLRNVVWSVLLSNDDVAVGVVEGKNYLKGDRIKTVPLVLSARDAKVGDTLFTFAYPKSRKLDNLSFDFSPITSIGLVNEHYPNGRDRVMLPNPCYQTSINITGGSSGGPVFNALGAVVGINTSGIDESIHYVSKINNILDMPVPDGSPDKMITIQELIKIGKVGVYIWNSEGDEETNVNYEYKVLVPGPPIM